MTEPINQSTEPYPVCAHCDAPDVCRRDDECMIDHHSLFRMNELRNQSTIELERGQTWAPSNGDHHRQIEQFRASDITSKYPLGTVFVQWVTHATRYGTCTERAFRRWIKHTDARVVVSNG